MGNRIRTSFLLFTTIFFFLLISCASTGEVKSENAENVKSAPVAKDASFEDIVKDKIWYTKLENMEGDVNLNNLYQIKLVFNTTDQTFVKETYKLQRYNDTNNYKAAGYNSQKGKYYYGKGGRNIYYELMEDYEVNANSSKKENPIDPDPKKVNYKVESENIIQWEGHRFYSKTELDGNSIVNFIDKEEVVIDG